MSDDGTDGATIAPWLSVGRATAALEFYKAAFGAVETERLDDDAGEVAVAHLIIGGADFWIQQADDGPDDATGPPAQAPGGRPPVHMVLTVADPDAVFDHAVAAGATAITPVGEGNGWRVGRLADSSGHHWEVGHPLA